MKRSDAPFLSDQMIGMLLVIAAGCCWGTSGTLRSLAPPEATSASVAAVRTIGSAVILLAAMLVTNARGFISGPWKKLPVLLAGTSYAGYQLLFFTSVHMTGAGVAAIVAIGSSPAAAGILGVLVFREKLTLRWYIATVMAVMGTVFITLGGTVESGSLNIIGVLIAVAAGLSYALEGIGIRLFPPERSSLEIVTALFIVGSLFLLPFLFTSDTSWILTPHGLLISALLALISGALPYFLFAVGLRRIGVAKSYTLSLSEPITAWILSTLLLGEALAPIALIGVGTVCSAILLLAAGFRSSKSE